MRTAPRLSRFHRAEDGAALVEFALLLPIFMLFIGLAVEGGRTFWAYQTTITGVRDATRYLGRVVESDACTTGASTTRWDTRLAQIVRTDLDGDTLLPAAVDIDSVTSSLDCIGGAYRGGAAPVATVTATLRIRYPFSGLMRLGGIDVDTVTTTVSDSTRIIG
ncbi:TadE/TadG family type IV pilus assembly protein [uncultured Sulfitobacter sp.]|uniref:TadE/TadG family type IV pilus assembly protein n=1 Tax=uncultured Sulfitobacter sp. TaxID=191468 RepID=UPI002615E71E|nr:TadE/TadG family type IV pilus assembly protein [uncultured Sulfitobacter sp.]